MLISVIIPTYNEEKNIKRLLTALNKQTLPREEYEIIVVDGHSTDRTFEIARKYADVAILQGDSLAADGARNEGAQIAKGKILAMTDADTIPPKHWLERIAIDFKQNPQAVAVCGPIYPIEQNPKAKLYFAFSYNVLLRVIVGISRNRLNFFTFGNNSAIKKDVFLKVGGYLEIGMAADTEISRRLKKYGEIIFDKQLYIYSSARRFEKEGYLKLSYKYLIMSIKAPILGKTDYVVKDYMKTVYD
ncbi:MAG: glycosyltransferase [Candidatus Asgardarchaeia archaeon]